jgi:hypothetical protein
MAETDEPTPEEQWAKDRKLAQEAKAIMEKRWNQRGASDYRRPCRWYSERYGNAKCGYKLERT